MFHNLKNKYQTTQIHVDINRAKGGELDIKKFKKFSK